jgi:hypothetical protein
VLDLEFKENREQNPHPYPLLERARENSPPLCGTKVFPSPTRGEGEGEELFLFSRMVFLKNP